MAECCYPNAPEDLKRAVPDIERTLQWTKGKSLDELLAAYDFIYVHHYVPRAIIQEAIAAKRHQQLDEHFNALRKPHWTVVPTFWLVILGIFVGIASAVISWLAWHQPVQPPAVSSSASIQPGLVSPTASPASVPVNVTPTSTPVTQATPAPKKS
jgi:hypothetical protein